MSGILYRQSCPGINTTLTAQTDGLLNNPILHGIYGDSVKLSRFLLRIWLPALGV